MILVIIVFALLAVGINTGGAMLSLTPLLGIGAMVIFVALFIGKKSKESVKVGPFAVCDVTALIAGYGGVIDCKLLECVLMDYRTDGDFQHLQVKAGMLLTRYENGGVCQYKSYLQLSLVKSIHALTQSINDVNVYRCDSCGASLSLLNGGRCGYCGQGLRQVTIFCQILCITSPRRH